MLPKGVQQRIDFAANGGIAGMLIEPRTAIRRRLIQGGVKEFFNPAPLDFRALAHAGPIGSQPKHAPARRRSLP
jgi:hypothetical protein